MKDWIGARVGDVVGFFTCMPAKIAAAAADMWDGIKDAFKSALKWIIGKWDGLKFGTPNIPGTSFGGVPSACRYSPVRRGRRRHPGNERSGR